MTLKQSIQSLTLVPSGGGAFEVTVDGQRIHSKLATGQFPDADALLKIIRKAAR